MHALFVTLRFSALPPSTQRELAHLSRRFATVDGHVNTTWLRSGATVALHQTFDSDAAIERYLESGILRELTALPGCRDLFIQEFDVLEGLGALPAARSSAESTPAEELVAAG